MTATVLGILRKFLQLEAASGLILMAATAVALVWSNSPAAEVYVHLLHTPVHLGWGLGVAEPASFWIDDSLMVLFFLVVGLEIKREMLEGELAGLRRSLPPAIAALGGMAAPAAIYMALNWGDPITLHGWAIPSATDIAFSVAVLALLGPRVPQSLKVFLLALAVIDDLGAIVIIAVFYASDLSWLALGAAATLTVVLVAFNRFGVTRLLPYLVVGAALWACVLQSGVHATVAGVVLALTIPLRTRYPSKPSPLVRLEEALHPWVAYGILPLFALANAGVPLAGALTGLFAPIPLGIALGLFAGKQAGVFLATRLAVALRIAVLPEGATWLQVYGVAIVTGIGFTMSLFIGTLAFGAVGEHVDQVRIGVLTGSLLSALAGYAVLRFIPRA